MDNFTKIVNAYRSVISEGSGRSYDTWKTTDDESEEYYSRENAKQSLFDKQTEPARLSVPMPVIENAVKLSSPSRELEVTCDLYVVAVSNDGKDYVALASHTGQSEEGLWFCLDEDDDYSGEAAAILDGVQGVVAVNSDGFSLEAVKAAVEEALAATRERAEKLGPDNEDYRDGSWSADITAEFLVDSLPEDGKKIAEDAEDQAKEDLLDSSYEPAEPDDRD